MTSNSLLRLAARLLAFLALAGTGTYVIVYLWRWEWNRALITGVLFLATLVVVSTWTILASLRRLSDRMEQLETRTQSASAVAETLRRASAGHATRHFDWLRERPDRLGVFVPILLGAGAILSGVAYLIERLAGAVGGPVVDRTTARLLAYDVPLGAPAGDLLLGAARMGNPPGREDDAGTASPEPGAADPTHPRPAGRREVGRAAIAAVGLAIVIAGCVWLLREATQTRADPPPRPARTELELVVHQRSGLRQPGDLAVVLWSACNARLPTSRQVELREVLPGSAPDRVLLVLDRTVGEHARRRLVGCMQDTLLDDVQGDVLRLTSG